MAESTPLTEQSPAWIHLVTRVEKVEQKIDDASSVARRTEKAVIGGFDDSGVVWRPGIRERLESVDTKVRWAGFVITAIFIGIAIDILNSYFGWFGASHAALKITGGH